jgi:hypothetical protein
MTWSGCKDKEEWADMHGYQQYRCPGCHQLYYSDSGPVGNCPCGWLPEEDDLQAMIQDVDDGGGDL